MPLWSRDGKTLVFASGGDLYRQASDGSGQAELLLKSAEANRPHDWSPDGEHIVYAVVDPKTQWDIWPLPLSGDRRPKPFLRTPSHEYQGRISPDGRWIAYASGESGSSMEVYVQSFPVPGRKRRISTSGGVEPQWRRDGKELFYLSTDQQIMSVNVTDPARNLAAPTPLFPVRVAGAARNHYLRVRRRTAVPRFSRRRSNPDLHYRRPELDITSQTGLRREPKGKGLVIVPTSRF